MRRIIFGLLMLWAALFGACQASAQFCGCPAGFCSCAAPNSGGMPLAISGTPGFGNNSGTGNTVTVSYSTGGNCVLIVDLIYNNFGAAPTVVSSTLGSFIHRYDGSLGSGANTQIDRWWFNNTSGAFSDTITITNSANTFSTAVAYCISGAATPSAPFDQATTTFSSSDPISYTPAHSHTMIIGAFGCSNGNCSNGSAGQSSLTSAFMTSEYQVS